MPANISVEVKYDGASRGLVPRGVLSDFVSARFLAVPPIDRILRVRRSSFAAKRMCSAIVAAKKGKEMESLKVVGLIIILPLLVCGQNSKVVVNENNDKNTLTYQKCKNAVATLRGTSKEWKTSGTGFLCEMDGKKYLVTNCHVIDHNIFMQVFFQDGRTYKLPDSAMVEIAANRDLARFDLINIKEMVTVKEGEYLSLALDQDVPDIGDEIEFYGNADGKDVITVTAGKILAVGLEAVEIDAKIQGGNSGSPLVRVKDGKVIGVTTFSTFNKSNDLSKVGTRYDPNVTRTREFAVRFTAVRWAPPVRYGEFVRDAKRRKEIKLFLGLLEGFCFGNMEFCLDKDLPNYRFVVCRDIKDSLNKLAKVDGSLRESRDRFDKMVLRNDENIRRQKGTGSIDSYSVLDFENQIKVIKMRTHKCFEARLDLLRHAKYIVQRALRKSDDSHKLLDDFLKCSTDEMIRSYQDKYRLQLMGSDLPNIPLVPNSARGAKGGGINNSAKGLRVRW